MQGQRDSTFVWRPTMKKDKYDVFWFVCRHEARDIIRNAVRASEKDVVIFAGHGCTGAVHKLIHALDFSAAAPPIVFVGPCEHHANLLPWREIGAEVSSFKYSAPSTEYLH